MGNIPREEVLSLQKKAMLLVNPRKPSVGLTRYSFPSKTMEYMASGTPMLGYALEGIPEEYYNHMFIPKDLSVDAMTNAINETLSKTPEELRQFGSLAKEFIRNNKESQHQVAKVIRFLTL
jgi:glycosyltransferase involved in cell wall biosynthesis